MVSVFLFSPADYAKLKTLLEADTLSEKSFARVGYYLRDAKGFGLQGYVAYFKGFLSEEQKLILKQLPSSKELSGEEFKKVVDVIETEENQAAQGFGSMFG
jgi:hypothetical protein